MAGPARARPARARPRGASRGRSRGAADAAGDRSGRRSQLLALLLAKRERRGGPRKRVGPTLLVCPMSVVGNWQREAERFAPSLRVQVHDGRERLAGRAFAREARASDLVLTTYALATRDREALGAVKWERIALDEAQNIESSTAKRTRAIRALPARHRVRLTGTPAENRLSELPLDHGLPQSRPARLGRELPRALRDADRALPGCGRDPRT